MKESEITLRDGRKLAYAEYGDPNGKPVFFFHGIPGSRLFTPEEEQTRRAGARIITTDRPGFGHSSFQRRRRITDWPNDLAALADALKIEKFHLFGHSGGTPYTLVSAWAMPERVRGAAVACGPCPPGNPAAMEGITPLNRFGLVAGRWMPWVLWQGIVWYLYRMGHEHPEYLFNRAAGDRPEADAKIFSDPEIFKLCCLGQSEGLRPGTRGFAWETRILVRPWSFPLEQVKVPVHIWHGTEDVDAPVGMGRALAAAIPGSKLTVLQGEAHNLIFPHWEEILTDLFKK
jgi:pimeloyl-ACP methyl ester carboxylesterase